MRVVIQRVKEARVEIEGKTQAAIGAGMLVLVGIEDPDDLSDSQWIINKITQLRIFNDASGVMNCSVKDIDGEIIIVSQFTLHASTKKGNRPSYIRASKPDKAIPLYEAFVRQVSEDLGKPVGTGVFGADMQISLVNDGPVTICIDSRNKE